MSVDNEKSFELKNRWTNYAVFDHANFGPTFGDGDLIIDFNLPHHVTELGNSFEQPQDEYYLSREELRGYLAGGKTRFDIQELEVHLLSW